MKSPTKPPSDGSPGSVSQTSGGSRTVCGDFSGENGPEMLSYSTLRDDEDIYDQIQQNNRQRKARKKRGSKNGSAPSLLTTKVRSMDQKLQEPRFALPLPSKDEEKLQGEDLCRLILDNFASLRLEEEFHSALTTLQFRLYLYSVLYGQEKHFQAPAEVLLLFTAKLEQLGQIRELSYNHDSKFVGPSHSVAKERPVRDGSRTITSVKIPPVIRKRLHID